LNPESVWFGIYKEYIRQKRGVPIWWRKEEKVQSQSNAECEMQKAESAGNGEEEKVGQGESGKVGGEMPNTKNQTPNNRQQSTNNHPQPDDSQLSTKDPQPSEISRPPLENPGSLSLEEALRFLTAVDIEARKAGRRLPKPWHVASMRAYLTGKEIMWLNPKNLRKEPVQPPTMDPRLNPESPWSRLWKDLEPAMNANEKN
jgi:hypothetical protein